jgi:hypothetical protein
MKFFKGSGELLRIKGQIPVLGIDVEEEYCFGEAINPLLRVIGTLQYA